MNILVDNVRIAGFRGIENIEISLPRVTVLIGTNNSGKTSVIKALQFALGDYSRYLTDEDFYINSEDVRSEKILVDVRVIPVKEDDSRSKVFGDDWAQVFEDKIQAEADDHQFLAIRTIAEPDKIKGGFSIERFSLDQWADFSTWRDEETSKKQQIRSNFGLMPRRNPLGLRCDV